MLFLILHNVAILVSFSSGVIAYGEGSENNCTYPEVYSLFYGNESESNRNRPPELHTANSTRDLLLNKESTYTFPYQYILMTCSAPYPIKWASENNVPQHYYFSYILDDEIRSVVHDNGYHKEVQPRDASNTAASNHDIFTVRLHIGNETMSTQAFSNMSVTCQPVDSGRCGNTVVFIRKYLLGERQTMLQIKFLKAPLQSQSLSSPITEHDANYLNNSAANECANWSYTKNALQCNHTWAGRNEVLTKDVCDLNFTTRNIKTNDIITNTCKDDQLLANMSSMPTFCQNEDIGTNISEPVKATLENLQDFLSLCIRNSSIENVYVGDTIYVTCISSIYYFAQGMRIQLVYNITNHSIYQTDLNRFGQERAFGPGGYRNITTTFIVETDNFQEIKCSAPVRQSVDWIVKRITLKPKDPIKVAFQPTPDTAITDSTGAAYLSCNASGDPLPKLSWSRLSNQQLPSNQTFKSYQSKDANGSSWVASTLHFPNVPQSNLTKYFGRYICTATNRFDSIEKVFLFQDSNVQDAASVFGDNVAFMKKAWFWIMVMGAMLMLVAAVMWLSWKLQKQAQKVRLFTKAEIDEFLFGKPDLLLDDTDMYTEMNSYADYLPFDSNQFEISREQLEFNAADILGNGAYGTVYKGTFKTSSGRVKSVAIKTVSPSCDKMYFAALLSEIKIMCYIGKHGNIVRFIGACTKFLDKRQIFVATEYCPNGDLLSYILNHRNTFISNITLGSQKGVKVTDNSQQDTNINGYCKLTYSKLVLSPHLLLVWALQIAQGMHYLSSKKVIHGDLAARNVLLAGDLKPKIADFGLSKQLQKYANYVRKGDDLVPWRWLAVESLQFMKFSIQSDVWAFGVVLYELFSLGQVPYGSHTYSEFFIVSLCQGERLHRPDYASDELYRLMLDCWSHLPENRPSFSDLENELRLMTDESESQMFKAISNSFSMEDIEIDEPHSPVAINDTLQSSMETTREASKEWQNTSPPATKVGYIGHHHAEPALLSPFQVDQSYVNHLEMPSSANQAESYIDWSGITT